jgi:hypothetical protein
MLLGPLLTLLNATHWWQLFRLSAIGNGLGFRVGDDRPISSCHALWSSSTGHLSLFHFLSAVGALTDALSGSTAGLRSHVGTDRLLLSRSHVVLLPCVYLWCTCSYAVVNGRSPRLLFVLGSGRSLYTAVSNVLKLTEIVKSMLLLILSIPFISFALPFHFFSPTLIVHLFLLCNFSFTLLLKFLKLLFLLCLFLLLFSREDDLALICSKMVLFIH